MFSRPLKQREILKNHRDLPFRDFHLAGVGTTYQNASMIRLHEAENEFQDAGDSSPGLVF